MALLVAQQLLARSRAALSQLRAPGGGGGGGGGAAAAAAFSQSTEARWSAAEGSEATFTGPFRHTRATLDYAFHLNYVPERQAVQDAIVARFLAGGARVAPEPAQAPAPPPALGGGGATAGAAAGAAVAAAARAGGPWLVYTAGAMGAGKSHTLRTLHAQGLFPLERFIWVDPDAIKGLLPDMRGYLAHNRSQAGALTHKESGFIAEIVTLEAMRASKCLVVDGTLRDRAWYSRWFGRVRAEFPHYRIAILMITAPRERVYERARRRAAVTSRFVERATLDDAMAQVPVSFAALAPLADFTAVFFNDDDATGPQLQPPLTREGFRSVWEDVRRAPAPAASTLSRRMLSYEGGNIEDAEEPPPDRLARPAR